jgi:endoglucanase Acf2
MKYLLSVLLLSFSSCAMSQKINGYITYSDIRKAVSASGNLKYDSTTGVFNYVQPVSVSTFSNDAGYLPLTKANTLYSAIKSYTRYK